MAQRKESEVTDIEQQRDEFKEDVATMKDELARNWRDMSLEVQRAMRARGVSDSSFAAGTEAGVLKDFNKGLRAIATKSTRALADFSQAVVETTQFYNGKITELETAGRRQLEDIDTWVRQNVQSIQAQENTALTSKLNQIRDAVLQGRQLKANVEQKIADQKLNYGMWLQQMQVNYQLAVAEAAKSSVGNAQQGIKDVKALFDLTQTIVDKGGDIVTQVGEDGKTQAFVHGKNPSTGEDIYIPVTSDYASQINTERQGQTVKNQSDILDLAIKQQVYGGLTGGNTDYTQALQTTGLNLPTTTNQNKGVVGSIISAINPFD